MSTTTQILFNTPALHSLKRDQLIKLCKAHNIKASGKNTELVEKLRKHAETLPRDAPLSVAARSENFTEYGSGDEGDETMHDATEREESQSANARWGFQMPKPSEQWDVVMENIEEVDEKSSQGTLNSLRTVGSDSGGCGEFGTNMSKSPSLSSSLKSLASSFGLKRGNVFKTTTSSTSFPSSSSFKSPTHMSTLPSENDILAQTSTSYSPLRDTRTPPQTDHFAFNRIPGNRTSSVDDSLPLPGHSLRPGVPAPSDARLSFGLNEPSTPTRGQPTTTIRLISNHISNNDSYGRTPQLQPFETAFDLDFGSPQPSGASPWPLNEGQQKKGLYPPLPLEDLISSSNDGSGPSCFNDMNVDASMPSSLAPHKPAVPSLLSPAPKSTTTTQLAVRDPFIFGSPLPQHNVSNSQFKSAAASVLEEMNQRLKQEGVDGVGMDLITKLQPGAHAAGVGVLGPRELKEVPKANIYKERFDKLHEEEFSKMEGIDSLVRRRRGLLVPKERAGPGLVVKRKSSASGAAGHGVGRDRFGRRIGGESGRLSAATMVNESRERRRSRVIPGAFGDDEDEQEAKAVEGGAKPAESMKEEDKKTEDETEIGEDAKVEEEQKEKEREAIKRKLEMNKARRKSSVASAKGRVSVGRGGVLVKPQPVPQPKPSRFGFLSSAKSLVAKVWGGGKTGAPATTTGTSKPATTKGLKTAPPPAPAPAPAPKKAPAPARPFTAANPSVGKAASLRGEKDATTVSSTTSSRSRPRIPSFTPAPSANTKGSTAKPSTTSLIAGMGAPAKSGPAVSSLGPHSSLASTSRSSSSGTVGSMGSKRSLMGSGTSIAASAATATGSSSFSRLSSSKLSSSRLLAPTASSLAKVAANKPSVSGSKSSLKSTGMRSGAQIQKSQSSGSETLSMITNSPRMPGEPWSPRPKRIFSKPLAMPSRIPTPTKKRATTTTTENGVVGKEDLKEADATTTGAVPNRQRSLNGRKPRISRSKVIAKLASQRAASTSRPGATPAKAGRTRSSLGVKAQRSSYGGKSISVKGVEDNVLMSAKKRVRQSEYARRKSHVVPIDLGKETMDVDAE
ncbi:hypothetical protein C0995_016394 [Termitomyces sp. Mi166|nr:hypothetical protein C0995_016394 [Termitomyces sp. Mi166\